MEIRPKLIRLFNASLPLHAPICRLELSLGLAHLDAIYRPCYVRNATSDIFSTPNLRSDGFM